MLLDALVERLANLGSRRERGRRSGEGLADRSVPLRGDQTPAGPSGLPPSLPTGSSPRLGNNDSPVFSFGGSGPASVEPSMVSAEPTAAGVLSAALASSERLSPTEALQGRSASNKGQGGELS